MRSSKLKLMMIILSLLLVSFLSVPVYSGNGDEDPWDADGTDGPNDGTIGDIVIPGHELKSIEIEDDPGMVTPLDNLIFSISFEIVNFFYGSSRMPTSQLLVNRSVTDSRINGSVNLSQK